MKKIFPFLFFALFLVACSATSYEQSSTTSNISSTSTSTEEPVVVERISIASINSEMVKTVTSSSFNDVNLRVEYYDVNGVKGSTTYPYTEYTALKHHEKTLQEFLLSQRFGSLPTNDVNIPETGKVIVLGYDEREFHIITSENLLSPLAEFTLANGMSLKTTEHYTLYEFQNKAQLNSILDRLNKNLEQLKIDYGMIDDPSSVELEKTESTN